METTITEEGIKEVRRVRHEISEEYDHDVDRLVTFYQEMEEDLRTSDAFRFADDGPEPHPVVRTRTSRVDD